MTQGTDSGRDVDQVIARVRERLPDVQVQQLRVKFPADDDGLWFLKLPMGQLEVQIESSSGQCPFLVENDASADLLDCDSVAVTVEAVVGLLGDETRWPPTKSEP